MVSILTIWSEWLRIRVPINGQSSIVDQVLPSKEVNKALKSLSVRNKIRLEAKIRLFTHKFLQFITSAKVQNIHWRDLKSTRNLTLLITYQTKKMFWAI